MVRILALAASTAAMLACGDEAGEPQNEAPVDFECVPAAHLQLRCSADGALEYCHSNYTPLPHFHLIRSCVDFGWECFTFALGDAACVLPDERCEGASSRCEEGRALNCDRGRWVVTPCGRRGCVLEEERADCAT